jgi:hypothetical protein
MRRFHEEVGDQSYSRLPAFCYPYVLGRRASTGSEQSIPSSSRGKFQEDTDRASCKQDARTISIQFSSPRFPLMNQANGRVESLDRAAKLLTRKPFQGRSTLTEIARIYCTKDPAHWKSSVLQWKHELEEFQTVAVERE